MQLHLSTVRCKDTAITVHFLCCLQAVQDTQRSASAAERSVTNLQKDLRDLKARQGVLLLRIIIFVSLWMQ